METVNDEWRKGYDAQHDWLEQHAVTRRDAEVALAARAATAEANDFNAGGDAATRDYIRRIAVTDGSN